MIFETNYRRKALELWEQQQVEIEQSSDRRHDQRHIKNLFLRLIRLWKRSST